MFINNNNDYGVWRTWHLVVDERVILVIMLCANMLLHVLECLIKCRREI